MEPWRAPASIIFLSVIVLSSGLLTGLSQAHTSEQLAKLSGPQVVPGPGSPNGDGYASIKSASEINTVCYKIRFKRIERAASAHIHQGKRGESGPVVVDLFEDGEGRRSPQEGCNMDVLPGTIEAIQSNPYNYYVDIHTREFPDGAIRGQLRNKAGAYKPPATCPMPKPVAPNAPSRENFRTRKIPMLRLTDAASELAPTGRNARVGPAFWVTPQGPPVQDETKFFLVLVDTASPSALLSMRASWETPAVTDIDLHAYDAVTGELVATSDAADTDPIDGSGGGDGRSEPGSETITGLASERCQAYVIEVRTLRSLGDAVRVDGWLKQRSAD